ncbi:hypothetical protein F511_45389 [Dorcoceras hygrometricum]|uniref:Uncharacterized protein n=1 Tax=Dorcoceras hygrometricum TaxID=472368 RepID=A0A2Z6ZWB7_9LAMI|nr:hypothetical protein F511_45389 [Dorcoceras hygrometricum]
MNQLEQELRSLLEKSIEEEDAQTFCSCAKDSAGRLCVDFSSRKLQWIQSQRKDFQTQCLSIQSQDEVSDASNSSIQSRAYLNQLLLYSQSRATVSRRKGSLK